MVEYNKIICIKNFERKACNCLDNLSIPHETQSKGTSSEIHTISQCKEAEKAYTPSRQFFPYCTLRAYRIVL